MRSYSEIVTFRRCQRKHYYSRVENLEPIQEGWRPSFGTWFHELLAANYLGGEAGWRSTHATLLAEFELDVRPFTTDEDVLAIPELAEAIMFRYQDRFQDYGWEVLHVEESFDYDGIGITPDLVVRTTSGIWVVDHKTSASLPEEWDLMADTQHLLYVGGMRRIYGEEVQGIIFNYIRSKLPTEPRLNKTIKGTLGHPDINNVARIDTDYETLAAFAAENGIPPYPALAERLAQLQAQDPFFQRYSMLTPQEACDTALEEAKQTAEDMQRAEDEGVYWSGQVGGLTTRPGAFPRTVLPQAAGVASCNACPFKELCQAELFGLDTVSTRMLYTERTPLNREYKEVSKAA